MNTNVMDKQPEAIERDLEADWHVDFDKYALSFRSELFEDALDNPPLSWESAPDMVTKRE